MDEITAALADSARWRILELLAERPRSVGELAERTGLRQPQTTKHLQTLARVGLVTVHPLGQRRVYALDTTPLKALGERVSALVALAEAHVDEIDVLTRYRAAIEAETAAATHDHWADDRTFSFDRPLPASPELVWRHWTDPTLLATWWVPPSMTITKCLLEPKPNGQAILDYRDAEGRYRSEGRVHTATEPTHLVFDLSVLDPNGATSFTAHYDLTLAPTPTGTHLHLNLRITNTSAAAAPHIAGIETGWTQVLDNLTTTLKESDPHQ